MKNYTRKRPQRGHKRGKRKEDIGRMPLISDPRSPRKGEVHCHYNADGNKNLREWKCWDVNGYVHKSLRTCLTAVRSFLATPSFNFQYRLSMK